MGLDLFLVKWYNSRHKTMKEVLIFIVIIIIALVALYSFQNNKIDGANLLSALKFDIKPPSSAKTKTTGTSSVAAPSQNQTAAPAPTIEPEPVPAPTPTPTPVPEDGVTSPKKPEALSLLYQKITISSVTKKTSAHPSVITLRMSSKEEIDITGFTVQTRHGQFKIPEGMEKYRAYGVEKDISGKGYLTIYLIGGKSPLNTDAFRINTCFGYLKQYNIFYPSVYNSCPKPTIEDVYDLNPFCQDYILKLRTCQIPDYSTNLKIASNSYCTSYINENLNYNGCYDNYSGTADFLKNYWYIYTKSDLVEPLHDIIYLYDQSGYLIDDYTY
jgi:hypothetical protein